MPRYSGKSSVLVNGVKKLGARIMMKNVGGGVRRPAPYPWRRFRGATAGPVAGISGCRRSVRSREPLLHAQTDIATRSAVTHHACVHLRRHIMTSPFHRARRVYYTLCHVYTVHRHYMYAYRCTCMQSSWFQFLIPLWQLWLPLYYENESTSYMTKARRTYESC